MEADFVDVLVGEGLLGRDLRDGECIVGLTSGIEGVSEGMFLVRSGKPLHCSESCVLAASHSGRLLEYFSLSTCKSS